MTGSGTSRGRRIEDGGEQCAQATNACSSAAVVLSWRWDAAVDADNDAIQTRGIRLPPGSRR